MIESAFGKVSAAAIGTAIALLIALVAVEHLDAPLKRASFDFAWSIPLLAGCFILDYAHTRVLQARKTPDRLVQYGRVLCFIVGATLWLQGATAVLQHFPIPPIQVVLLKAVLVLVVAVATVAVIGGTKKSKDD